MFIPTKGDIIELWKVIESLVDKPAHIKFNYAVLKNRKLLENEIKTLEELSKPSEEFIEFESERYRICSDYSEKDQNGSPILENGVFKIKEDLRDECNSKLLELRDKYINTILEREDQSRTFEINILNEPSDIQLYKVESQFVPNNLNVSDLASLYFMIDEELETKEITLTFQDLLYFWTALKELGDFVSPENFNFIKALAYNYNVVRPMIFSIEKDHLPREEYFQYERKLSDLQRRHADTTESGTPKLMPNGAFIINEHIQEYQQDLEQLQNEYKYVIEYRNNQINHINRLMNENLTIKIVKVNIENFPNTLTPKNLQWLYPMVEDLE